MTGKHFGVIGLGFGDEGKGMVTNYLAGKNPGALVTRFSGGQQAGHTVERNETRHVFSNFGAGTLNGNATYFSPFCTIDPEGILNEYKVLSAKGITDIDLFIDANCPVTTPYEKFIDVHSHTKNKEWTCGVGVGATKQREEDMYSLTFGDLFYPQILNIKMDNIREKYYRFVNKPEHLDLFFFSVEAVKKIANITYGIPTGVSQYIFEGSQGLMLDQNIGFFPYVTRSNTGSKNILSMVNHFNPFLVTRCYETRHGAGPMTGVPFPVDNAFVNNIVETNVLNTYQGEFRKAVLNIDTLKYALIKDGYLWKADNTLVITCMDHMEDYYYFCNHVGNVFTFDHPFEFARAIGKYLAVNDVRISFAADGSDIRKVDM